MRSKPLFAGLALAAAICPITAAAQREPTRCGKDARVEWNDDDRAKAAQGRAIALERGIVTGMTRDQVERTDPQLLADRPRWTPFFGVRMGVGADFDDAGSVVSLTAYGGTRFWTLLDNLNRQFGEAVEADGFRPEVDKNPIEFAMAPAPEKRRVRKWCDGEREIMLSGTPSSYRVVVYAAPR